MGPYIGLLFLSVLVGCGAGPSTAREDARRPDYPWEGASWSTDIVIDGPEEDQDAVRSFIYYLKHNDGLDPFGGTNNRYKSRVFWDADVWVFPALALIDPERAKAIPEFRLETAQVAQLDTCLGIDSEARERIEQHMAKHLDTVEPDLPLRFPWEADERGDETAEAPTRSEEHGSGGVAWGLTLASDLGLADAQKCRAVCSAVANWYLYRCTIRGDGTREILDVVSVDEWHDGDNCLYTNAIAEWAVREFVYPDAMFKHPRNEKGELVAYEGDPVRAYQQAAAPLILWPLEREDLVDDPIAFLDRFEGKEAPSGPAMSLSVYALIRARYGDANQTYETWQESWKKYTDDNPMLMFSEKPGRKDLTYFNTGAAGCLNAVIYGFIGARIVDDASKDGAKIELKNGRWLVFRPNLPKAWKKVTFKGMQVLGKSYTVVCEGRGATISDGR